LAAGLFNLLSEFAATQAADKKQTPAALLRALGSGSQLWANAKDASRKKGVRLQSASILKDPDMKSSDKIKKLIKIGDYKGANEFAKMRAAHKANKRSKENNAETILRNRNTEAAAEKSRQQKADIALKTLKQTISENEKKRGFQQGEKEKDRIANYHNTVNAALGRYGEKNKMKASDYLRLINDYELAYDINHKPGLPYFGTNERTDIKIPTTSNPTKKDLEIFEKKLRGEI
jgi:hypothetical protein